MMTTLLRSSTRHKLCQRFCQGSRRRLWPTRAGLAMSRLLQRGVDEDAVLGMQVAGCHGATRAHRPGLSEVPLPPMRQAVQRALWHLAEPDPVSVRWHRPRGALALALQAEPTRSARDVRSARHRVQL